MHTQSTWVDVAELVGISDIAQRCEVSAAAVSMWRKRYETFPEPVHQLRMGPLFLWPQVDAWHDARYGSGS